MPYKTIIITNNNCSRFIQTTTVNSLQSRVIQVSQYQKKTFTRSLHIVVHLKSKELNGTVFFTEPVQAGGRHHVMAQWVKASPYSIAPEPRIPELIPVLGCQPAGEVSHKPAVSCHYFPPGLQLPPQPLRGLLPILLLGEQRHNGCEQFA